jgi:hypothetical protein
MGRIDPRFGLDFRPGLRDQTHQSIIPALQDLNLSEFQTDYQFGDELEDSKISSARGIIYAFGIGMAAWAVVIAIIILLVWGI